MTGRFFYIASLLACLFFAAAPVAAEGQPLWWEQAEVESKKGGYTLLSLDDLKAIYDSQKPALFVDVRPDYEYNRGHLPKAVNLEFDLGERLALKAEKRQAFEKILGSDKTRTVVIYCRNFR
jgi:rhodanese-related sulfurtransferase